MAHILHLSDLHLRSDPSQDVIGDAKDAVIPAAMQQTNKARIISTLEALAQEFGANTMTLDCIVVSGDIADRNAEDGYALLPQVLAPLVPQFVPPERVVIVPGNHDVKKGTDPSSIERWKNFLTLRAHGYLTPLLEGVDIDNDGNLTRAATRPPVLVALDGSFTLVALNSANHSQIQLPVENDLIADEAEITNLRATHASIERLWAAWKKRGEVDAAWIGNGQQKVAGAALTTTGTSGPDALRIAVLHHQLFPAGPIAEVKSFETMVNLGEVLDWIADNRIDVVLHGHKHTARIAPFEHSSFHDTDTDNAHRTLVISAPTAQTGHDGSGPIARLISVNALQPRVGGVAVRAIPAVQSAGRIDISRLPTKRYRLDTALPAGRIVGETADEVHQKILALRGDYAELKLPLICRIARGETASVIPTCYPDAPEGHSNPQQWFTDTAAWWQAERAGKAAKFNHGQRLQAFPLSSRTSDHDGIDQIGLAVSALKRKEGSSRAIAVLIDPAGDLTREDSEFPAFALAQFTIVSGQLNVTAYFRKQEMPHWWPINAAELCSLQQIVIARLASTHTLTPGSITTITNQPVSGGAVPRVAIPALDTRIDRPMGLLELCLPLFHLDGSTPDQVTGAWGQAFNDWAPRESGAADGDPMPLLGLSMLIEVLCGLAELYQSSANDPLIVQLQLLEAVCKTYDQSTEAARVTGRPTWVSQVGKYRARIAELVAELINA